jgi:hypothetical protein
MEVEMKYTCREEEEEEEESNMLTDAMNIYIYIYIYDRINNLFLPSSFSLL